MPDNDPALYKFSRLRGKYGDLHKRIERSRQLYDLDFDNDVLPAGARARGFRTVIPRTARRIVDEASDHVLYHPKVSVPVRPTESKLLTEQEIAEKKRKACTAWWRQVGQRFNPLGDGRKWLFLDGMIAIKQTCRLDLLPDKGAKDYREQLKKLGRYDFLWDVELLDSTWVYIDPTDHRNPKYGFINYGISIEAARRKFPKSEDKWRDRDDYDQVQFLEYWSAPTFHPDGSWTPGKFMQWIDEDNVHSVDNPYPYVPIAVEDSGYGKNHISAEPEDRFVGLLDYSESVLIAQARQWTAMEAVAELTAFNPVKARNMSEEAAAKLNIGPGEIWFLDGAEGDPAAEDVVFPQWPPIPVTVPQVIALTDRELNGATKMDMLGGIPQSGVDTATEADQNVRNASAKLSAPVAALERLAAKMTRWFLMDIELVLEAPVTLYGSGPGDPADITLTPREINGYFDVFVQLRTTDEEALDLTRARFWGEMYRVLPFLSAWTAMEAGGIADDPLAEMVRRAGEDVFMSESFRMIREATGAASFGELAQYITQLQNQKGGAGGGPAGGPPSDEGLITQEGIGAPVEDRITTDALMRRDTEQAASMMRGAEGSGGGYAG